MKLNHIPEVTTKEKKNLYLLLGISGLYTLGLFLSNIFVNIFLWRQSGDIALLTLYNLAIYTTQGLIFLVAGKWVKRHDRVIILRVGIILISLFFVAVLMLGEYAANYYLALGAVLGAGYGFYWLAYNVLTFEVTEPHTRDYFNSTVGGIQSISGMIGPLFSGFLITILDGFKGYLTIFFLSFLLFLGACVLSFYLERRQTSGQYFIKRALHEKKANPNWSFMLKGHFLQGTREGVFLFLVGLFVFMITDSELALGIYNFIYAIAALLIYQLLSRYAKPSIRKRSIVIGSVTLYLSVIWLIFATTQYDLYIYALFVGLALPLFFVPFTSISYDVIGQAKDAKNYRVEYVIFREITLNVGRITSLILFWIGLNFFTEDEWIRYALLIFGAGYVLAMLFVRRIQLAQHFHHEKEEDK